MNVDQLMEIKEKLKKYNVLEKIEDIGEWLSKLNDMQISNLLGLNIDSSIASQNAEYILDLELLNISPDHDRVMTLIVNAVNDKHKQFLRTLALDLHSIKRHSADFSFYHELRLIADALKDKNSKRVEYLCVVAKNQASKNLDYQTNDMERILDAKTDTRARLLYDVATNLCSLSQFYFNHISDMSAIAEAKNDEEAIKIHDNLMHKYGLKQQRVEELENFDFNPETSDLHDSNEKAIDYVISNAFSEENRHGKCVRISEDIPEKLLRKIRKSTKKQ